MGSWSRTPWNPQPIEYWLMVNCRDKWWDVERCSDLIYAAIASQYCATEVAQYSTVYWGRQYSFAKLMLTFAIDDNHLQSVQYEYKHTT